MIGCSSYWKRRWTVALAGVAAVLFLSAAFAKDTNDANKIRVAIYADDGAATKPKVGQCLPGKMGFDVECVSAEEIREGVLDNFDVVIHPGGSGSKQAAALGEDGRKQVRQFVKRGGGFIGICAGAYLASSHYPWSLDLLNARVVDREHWARGGGEVKLRLPPAGQTAFSLDKEIVTIRYMQGPLLAPADKKALPDYELLAAFETEVAKNGAPQGVMKGTTAIARGQFGTGRVVCFSPHPEKTPGLGSFVRQAVRWAADAE
jgi:glutamine amidotransferase-like uncharacterized protein